jgi:hypothetical protein
VIVAALLASTAVFVPEGQSYITVVATPSAIKKGDPFVIDVKATAAIPVNAINIVIDYPVNQIHIDGIDTGQSVITLWAKQPYAQDGQVHLSGGVFGQGFIGEHTIARIKGTAIESGAAHVTTDKVQFVAGNGTGEAVQIGNKSTVDSPIYIANANGSLVGTATVDLITDVNGDGKVDLTDISQFMSAWFSGNHPLDFNGDGRMTFSDFSILLSDAFFN